MSKRSKLILVSILLLIQSAFSALVALDLGSESYKLALFQKKLDIILNDASQRKNLVSLAFYRGDYYSGQAAENLATRLPTHVLKNYVQLLGRSYDDPTLSADVLQDYYPFEIAKDEERNSFKILHPEKPDTWITPEELVALTLTEAKEIAIKNSGTGMTFLRDLIIAVPPFWTQHQREALINAAKLADIPEPSLVNQNSAVAVAYGLDRTFDGQTTVIFYDMGSASTTATLVTYSSKKKAGSEKNSTVATVVATTWDENLGGRDFTERLAKYFCQQFSQTHNKDYCADLKTMAKFRKEAKKAKEILSANTHTIVTIESIADDKDFSLEITREKFEELCQDLFPRATSLITQLLTLGGLSANEVSSMEIVGGGLRIPRVQTELSNKIGKPLDKHLNGDESAVFGSAYFGAINSGSLRGRDFKIKDLCPFPVSVEIISDMQDVNKNNDLFTKSKYGAKRSLTFKTNENFTIALEYKSPENEHNLPFLKRFESVKRNLGTWFVEVPSTEEYNHTGEGHVKASFQLSTSGIVFPDKVESELEIYKEVQVKVQKKKDSEETSSNNDEVPVEEEAVIDEDTETEAETENADEENATEEGIPPEGEAQPQSDEASQETTEQPEEEEVQYETKIKKTKKVVPCKMTRLSDSAYSPESFQKSRTFLNNLRVELEAKKEREKSMNTLETFIYEWKNKIQDDDPNYLKFTNEEQRDVLQQTVSQVQDWFDYDTSEKTLASEYTSQFQELKKLTEPIAFRISEYDLLPKTLYRIQEVLNTTKTELKALPLLYEISESEIQNVEAQIAEFEAWLSEQTALQAEQKDLSQTPVLTSNDVILKWAEWDKSFKKLKAKRIPKKKPVLPNFEDLEKEIKQKLENQEQNENQQEQDENQQEQNENQQEQNENQQKQNENQQEQNEKSIPDEL